MNCGVTFDSLTVAVRSGLVSEAQLDRALARLFRARFRLGMFDPPDRVPFAAIPYEVNDSEEHRALALDAARKSMVLLKNEGGLLPLSDALRTIAVLGPNADDVDVLLGNYHGIPSSPVTPLEGILERVSGGGRVLFARGTELAENIPFLEPVPPEVLSLEGSYFPTPDWSGEPFGTRPGEAVDFNWWEAAPIEGLHAGEFSVRWTGTLVAPSSGRFAVGGRALGRFRLFLDDSLLVNVRADHDPNTAWEYLELTQGRAYDIRVDYSPTRPDAMVRLLWAPPDPNLRAEALRVVDAADVVIMVMGLSPRLEGEEMPVEIPGFSGGDRTDLGLPPTQQELMEAVVGRGKPVVLVLLNGSALGLGWAAENVSAILEAWYPGQAAGTALADVLFGDYNPAGRLPVTFYESVDQLPPFDDYHMAGRTYRYFGGMPVFPFGHGLSYTTFAYRDLETPQQVPTGSGFQVSVEVENTGAMAGEEVIQLYVTALEASRPQPIRSLQGFRRVALGPGERTRVTFTLDPRQVSLIDGMGRRIVEPGRLLVSVGGKQPGFSGHADAATTGVLTGRVELRGPAVVLPG